MAKKHKRKTTFLGGLVILGMSAFIIFLFINFVTNYQINNISRINKKYNITENFLVPENTIEYTLELQGLKEEKFTPIILDYIYVMQEAEKIKRYIEYSYFETGCVTRTTHSKIESQIENTEALSEKILQSYSKKLDKIYWINYYYSLEEYNIQEIKEKANTLEMC